MTRFELKIVSALLLIAVLPLAASVVLVGQVIRVSDSVAEGQTRRLTQPMEQAAEAYRSLFATLKVTLQLKAKLMAADPALVAAVARGDRPAAQRALDRLLGDSESAGKMALLSPAGAVWLERRSERRYPPRRYRDLTVTHPLTLDAPSGEAAALAAAGARTLRVVFFTSRRPFRNFSQLGRARQTAAELTRLRSELGTYYRVVFFILFGAVLVLATGIGLLVARRTARRVAALAGATRKVAEGDLDTRVYLRSRDELQDLAIAFNEMVRRIKDSSERIAYLEKIGAWQQIARRLAHEIKNPLTPIQLAMQQVSRKYDGDDPRFARMLADAEDIITEEVEALRRMVQAFSAFAKLPEVSPRAEDLNGLIDDFLKSRSEMQERASVAWTPLEPPVTVMVDRMLIKHVLFNLVENALQAAEEAGTTEELQVTLAAEVLAKKRRLRLTVSDNGPGMAPEVYQRVFDPYFTTKEHGTGLGLAIVKKIVLEHRGSISVRSTPGEGTRFSLELPLAEVPSPPRKERASVRLLRRGGRS